MFYFKMRSFISDFVFRRPQQARQPGATGGAGGQGNVGSGGYRGGKKEALQPANIPVSKSMFSIDF
jgi:hypothetical protein